MKRSFIVFLLSLVWISLSFLSLYAVYKTDDIQNVIDLNYRFTEQVEAVPVRAQKTVNNERYQIMYKYQPQNSEPHYITYEEMDKEPDLKYIYVKPGEPTKVQKTQTDKSDIIFYILSQPTTQLALIIIGVLYIASLWSTIILTGGD